MSRRFAQVDVFTAVPGLGNPVAVVIDAEGLPDQVLARIANWTNLSETTFVLPPTSDQADYRVRIFTPSTELPFAGHPTLGTCRALLDAGLLSADQDRWVQECGAGLVPITARTIKDDASPDRALLTFTAPPARFGAPPVSGDELARILGGLHPADPLTVDVGPHWVTGRVSLAELDGLSIDLAAFAAAFDGGVDTGINLYAVDEDRTVHVRSFFVAAGEVTEDPVCGSGNAAVGAHLLHTGHAGDVPVPYEARQGRHRARDGHLRVTPGERIQVSGEAVTVITGHLHL